jgi:5-methyltetrahydropteroyltriglutamate--homocysteine methyltransferase
MSQNTPPFGVLLPTTVVGSYPVIPGHGLSSIVDPLRSAVKTAVEDQVSAGIDIISDGQVRGNMIQAFASGIPGINGQDVIGKVQPATASITAGDIKYALSKKSMVKGIITGPSTLAHGLHISTAMYRNREELALDLAAALSFEAKSLEKAGITILQIDEPIFSTGIADLSAGKQAIDLITRNLQVPVCMHVCGNLSEIIDDLLKFPVSILDFEFSNNPSNLALFDSRSLSGRMIGYGCVDSTRDEIETVGEIRTRIKRGLEIFGPEAMLLDPDCGMRMLTRDAAFRKLKNMAEAAKIVRKELVQDI